MDFTSFSCPKIRCQHYRPTDNGVVHILRDYGPEAGYTARKCVEEICKIKSFVKEP
ncbi:MAG: hypothetical protein Q6368_006795 [Candidatus Baldrarchaeota archaeon]